MMTLVNVLLTLFYISSASLIAMCVLAANAITKNDCQCIKHSLVFLIFGIFALICSVVYTPPMWHRLLAILLIFWGLTGWLFFSRHEAHVEVKDFSNWLVDYLKRLFY